MKRARNLEHFLRDTFVARLSLGLALTPALAFSTWLLAGTQPLLSATRSAQASASPSSTDEQDVTTIEQGKVIDRELSGIGSHRYRVNLAAGQYANLLVDQRGIDVSADVLNSDGKPSITFNFDIRPQGSETIELVADSATTFEFLVRGTYLLAPAGRYQIQIKEIRPATESDRTLFEARKLGTASDNFNEAGKYDDAIKTGTQAVEMTEKVLGPDDPFLASMLLKLALTIRTKGDIAKAAPMIQRAVDIDRKALGEEDPRTAQAICGLGLIAISRSDDASAQTFLQKALEISERVLGPDNPQATLFLMNLAKTQANRGNYEIATAETKRALAISEKTLGPNDTQTMRLTYNLGDIYLSTEQLDLSQELTQKALVLFEKKYGPDHPNVAYPLQNLGILARRRKQYDLALEYFWRSEKIRETALGSQNTLTATLLVNIGNVYASKGDMAKSLELYLRALDIFEITASPYSEATLKTLNNISRTYAVLKDTSRAVEFQERVDKTVEKSIALNLAVGSEKEKLAFAEDASYYTQRSISMHVREAPDDQRAAENAVTALLQRKGRVLDAVSGSMAVLRLHLKPEDQKLLEDLSTATTELASLSLSGPKKTPPSDYKNKLGSLEKKRDTLEDEISRRSQGYYSSDHAVTLAAVQSAIPSDAALLEFSVFVPFDPNASLEGNQFGVPRYVVYVITNRGDVRWKDLGLAADVDTAVGAFREALRDPARGDAKQASRALALKVLDPLRPLLGESKHLLVSPDGQLNLVPFGALLDEKSQFALERYSISYLSTGRDLLRLQASRSSKSGPVLFADPFFGDPDAVVVAKGEKPGKKSGRSVSERRSVTTAADISSFYFAPLAGTAAEANSIHTLFPQSVVFTGSRATKSALKGIAAPSILHIATHGFFLQEAEGSSPSSDTLSTRGADETPSADPSNPLLRSGLAFAGANIRKSRGEDGIFTALEASNLNLWGTKLVTLSACDTGVGEVKTGEGVYGLRRAFFLAGTESLVMSLWPVSDSVTRELMAEYYAGLKRGNGRSEALRQAQLAMLKRKGREHPFYWASFIESGEWANLDGRR